MGDLCGGCAVSAQGSAYRLKQAWLGVEGCSLVRCVKAEVRSILRYGALDVELLRPACCVVLLDGALCLCFTLEVSMQHPAADSIAGVFKYPDTGQRRLLFAPAFSALNALKSMRAHRLCPATYRV